jgi:L-Ala-D/L-Glu epimerase
MDHGEIAMQLASCELHAYCLPYERPVKWSDIVEEGGTFLMLRLRSADGQEGVAEMTTKPTWTGFGLQALSAALKEVLLPRLAGLDVGDAGAVAQRLDGVPGLHAPKALLDNALWDMRACAAGQPLWRLWQGQPQVPVSFTVTRQAPEHMAREAADLVERLGLRLLKIKGGQGVQVDAQVLRALRSASTSTPMAPMRPARLQPMPAPCSTPARAWSRTPAPWFPAATSRRCSRA